MGFSSSPFEKSCSSNGSPEHLEAHLRKTDGCLLHNDDKNQSPQLHMSSVGSFSCAPPVFLEADVSTLQSLPILQICSFALVGRYRSAHKNFPKIYSYHSPFSANILEIIQAPPSTVTSPPKRVPFSTQYWLPLYDVLSRRTRFQSLRPSAYT